MLFGIANKYVLLIVAVIVSAGLTIDHYAGPHIISGGIDDSTLLKGDKITVDSNGHLTNGTHVIIDHKVYALESNTTASNDGTTANDNSTDDNSTSNDISTAKTSSSSELVYSITDFKDWVNGKLDIISDANDVEVFDNINKAQTVVDDVWNKHHDRSWNIDNTAIEIANLYGDNDPVISMFYSSDNMFVVTKKSSGIGPQVWSPDKDGKLLKVTPNDVKVYAVDKLAKEA